MGCRRPNGPTPSSLRLAPCDRRGCNSVSPMSNGPIKVFWRTGGRHGGCAASVRSKGTHDIPNDQQRGQKGKTKKLRRLLAFLPTFPLGLHWNGDSSRCPPPSIDLGESESATAYEIIKLPQPTDLAMAGST